MKKFLIILFLLYIICLTGRSVEATEITSPIVPTQINARIIPLVWYSTLSINDGDSIKIYSGIQNNSGVDFTGTATFYVDDKNVADITFSSTKDSLKDISASWVAVPGSHSVQVKVITSLPTDENLVSYDSDKSNITIVKKVVKEDTVDTITNTVSNIISQIDGVAIPLADKIESFKKPIVAVSDDTNSLDSINSKNSTSKNVSSGLKNDTPTVLGASTGPEDSKTNTTTGNNQMNSAFNIVLDALSFLVKNWLWTLGGILILFILMKVRGRKKR